MSGRRSHSRFEVIPTSDAVLTMLRDVVVVSSEDGEAMVLSRDAGVVGETLVLEIAGDQTSRRRATVVESRPVVVDGIIRHRLRLQQTAEIGTDPETAAVGQAVVERR